MAQAIQLSDHFTLKRLLKFTLGPILTLICISCYSVVDGIIISNMAGLTAYAGVNLIFPVTTIVGGLGFMFSSGGSALVSKKLGEKDQDGANKSFTNILIFTILIGVVLSVLGLFLVEPIAEAMGKITNGSTQEMVDEAVKYGQILMVFQFGFMLQMFFQSFLIVDEKPKLSFWFTMAGGITNAFFDWLFIGPFKMGVSGAAIATSMGYLVAGFGPLIYFFLKKTGTIYIVKCRFELHSIFRASFNGLSEFFGNIALAILGVIFNILLLKYIGENGVIAYGTLSYVLLPFISLFIGFSNGTNPLIAYNFGAQNKQELKNITKKALFLIGCSGLLMAALAQATAYPIALLYSHGDKEVIKLTEYALRIYSIQFLFVGFSMFLSSFFTGLNNGIVSALISIIRIIIFNIGCVILFAMLFKANGIWWSTPISELIAMIFSFLFFIFNKKKYGY